MKCDYCGEPKAKNKCQEYGVLFGDTCAFNEFICEDCFDSQEEDGE